MNIYIGLVILSIVLCIVLTAKVLIPYVGLLVEKEYNNEGLNVGLKAAIFALLMGILTSLSVAANLEMGANKILNKDTEYIGAQIVARATDGAYIFEEMEYETGETFRYNAQGWLPTDEVYLLTVDKKTREIYVIWRPANDGVISNGLG